MIRAAFFDLDMCLFDTTSLGPRFLDPVLDPIRASSLPPTLKQQAEDLLWSTSLEDLVERLSIPEDVAEAMREAHADLTLPEHVRMYDDIDCVPLIAPYRVLVTTGYLKWQNSKIDRFGLRGYPFLFHQVIIDVVGEGVRKGKKAIFADLLGRHGWDPREVLVIGDNPHSELAAGKALGMVTVQTLRPGVVKAEGFDHYVMSLLELLAILN